MKDIVFKTVMLKGESGSSVVSVEKTETSGFTDTYTMTFNDGTSVEFTVTNGYYIETVEKNATYGNVDEYAMTMNNGDVFFFEVTNGASYEVPTDGVILFDGNSAPEGYEIIPNPTSSTTSLTFIKKVSATVQSGYGEIINSFNTGDDKDTNAPSLQATIERTDNNLLINSDLNRAQDIQSTTPVIKTSLLGWTNDSNLVATDEGLEIPNSGTYPRSISQIYYDYKDDIRQYIDYITVSLEYVDANLPTWVSVSKTINLADNPSYVDLFTHNGCTVKARPLYNGYFQLVFNSKPTVTFTVRNLKVERGTGATEYKRDMRPYAAMRGAIEAVANRYDTKVNQAATDITNIKSDITDIKHSDHYHLNEFQNFEYYGGAWYMGVDPTYVEIAFSIPLCKPIGSPEEPYTGTPLIVYDWFYNQDGVNLYYIGFRFDRVEIDTIGFSHYAIAHFKCLRSNIPDDFKVYNVRCTFQLRF